MNLKKLSIKELKILLGSGITGQKYKDAMNEYRVRYGIPKKR